MSRGTRSISIAVLTLVVAGIPALGVEGRIPIFAQTTITEPGSYIVTQDFSVGAGNAITISASNVTLDLNGHTITNAGTSVSDVNVFVSTGFTRIRVRDGYLVGGGTGIMAQQGSTNVDLLIDHVEVANTTSTGILVYGARVFELSSSVIRSTLDGMSIIPVVGTPFTGRIVNNIFDSGGAGIAVYDCSQVEIRGNNITARQNNGLVVYGCPGSRIEGNTLSYASGTANFSGLIISSSGVAGPGMLVLNNTIRGFLFGIQVISNGNHVAGNVVQATSHGIVVGGLRNLFEDNLIEGSGGCGNYDPMAGVTNAYRNNMWRGNTGGAFCGLAQTDAGGNIQ